MAADALDTLGEDIHGMHGHGLRGHGKYRPGQHEYQRSLKKFDLEMNAKNNHNDVKITG